MTRGQTRLEVTVRAIINFEDLYKMHDSMHRYCSGGHLAVPSLSVTWSSLLGARAGNGSTNMDGSRGSRVSTCDPLTHDPLADDEIYKISRTISITFGKRIIKRLTFFTAISTMSAVGATSVLCTGNNHNLYGSCGHVGHGLVH